MTGDNRNVGDSSEAAQFRRGLLLYPNESDRVEYKAAVRFEPGQPFTSKLIKHIIAMANSGGGNIVIGFSEGVDRGLAADPEMNEEVAATYEVTEVIRHVSACTRGDRSVGIQIHKEALTEGGLRYPILTISGFERSPFFCSSLRSDERQRPILKVGALYIRSAEAATVELANPEDWERLIDLAVIARQSDLLQRFRSLAADIGFLAAPPSGPTDEALLSEFQDAVNRRKAAFVQELNQYRGGPPGFNLVAHAPAPRLTAHLTPGQLRAAARTAERPNTGWPMGLVVDSFRDSADHTQVMPSGIRTVIGRNSTDHYDDWSLDYDGFYFLGRLFQEDTMRPTYPESSGILYSSTLIWRAAEALEHASALYTALGIDGNHKILLSFQYVGLQNRFLASQDGRRDHSSSRPANTDEITISLAYSLDELSSDIKNITYIIISRVYSLFGIFEVRQSFFDAIYDEYNSSRVR